MPLKIREINLSLPLVALTFLLRSTVCQSHSLPLEICLSQRSEALLAEIGPWGVGRILGAPGFNMREKSCMEERFYIPHTLQHASRTGLSMSLDCVCVCVCLNSPSTTKTVQEFAKWLVAIPGILFVAALQHACASLITRAVLRGFHMFLETVFALMYSGKHPTTSF